MISAAVLQCRPLAEKYAALHPVLRVNEILASIQTESSGNPQEENPRDPSWGLMGVTMLIARAFGGVTDPQQLLDPDTNVKCGSGFLAHLKATYKEDYPGWVAGYNEGEGNLRKGIADQPYVDTWNKHLAELDEQFPDPQ